MEFNGPKASRTGMDDEKKEEVFRKASVKYITVSPSPCAARNLPIWGE